MAPEVSSDFPLDKLAHFTFFFVFALLWMYASALSIRQRTALVGASGILYGILIEVIQAWLPFNRAAEPWDAVADFLGLLAGLLVYFLARARSLP